MKIFEGTAKASILLGIVLSAVPVEARTIHVPAGGNLAAAITEAVCGDTITLEADATYSSGSGWTLPAKGCDAASPITIKTQLVTVTERNKCTGTGLAKVQSTGNGEPTIRTTKRADYWIIAGLEITGTGTNAAGVLHIGSAEEAVAADQPTGIVLLGNYIHKATEDQRGVAYNAREFTAKWNCIANIRITGQDSQAIGGWNAPGPCLIKDNYLHAAGENILFGGADPAIPNLITSDCTIVDNTLEKDPAWCGKGLNVKNLFELKNARHFLIERNTMRYSCVDAQDGWAVLFTTQNQSGKCTWCNVSDIVFRYNLIRDVASGFNIGGRDGEGDPSGVMFNMLIEHNVVATNVRTMGPGGWCAFVIASPMANFTVRRNTFINEGSCLQVDSAFAPSTGVVWEDNLARHGNYGVVSSRGAGTPTFNHFWAPGYVFSGNVLAGGLAAGYDLSYYPAPAVNTTMPTQAEFEAGFVSYAWPYVVKPDGLFAGKGALIPDVAAEPAPVNPCVASPLKVTVTRWPRGNGMGGKSGTWDDGGAELVYAAFYFGPQRFEAMDQRGCTVRIVR